MGFQRLHFVLLDEVLDRIVFHGIEELRRMLGVGTLLKEQKVVDRRPKGLGGEAPPAPAQAPRAPEVQISAPATSTASSSAAPDELEEQP